MKEELSSLDLEVKRMMLEHPSLFPSRLECLEFLFCVNGTGYEWQEDGSLKDYDCRSGRTPETVMPEHIEKAEPYDFRITNGILDEHEKIRMEYEDTVRGFIDKNIDYLCQDIHHTNSRLKWSSVYPMSWDYCQMGKAADMPDKIEASWRNGIKEFINWYLPQLNNYFGIYSGRGEGADTSRIELDRRANENREICLKVLKKLRTPEDDAVDKLMAADLDELIAKIEAEKNG